ncbi:HNH endonuclease [Rhodococcus rhodochrous]|uniref:HNH endonuclease n=1 Tax=Rhodococcus rhodochrous TaxID=1829 RepID=UPI0024B99A78|nr:HNH endonuclease [Rhodococcus rhodochrous]MDJ0400882.1 HNH endonuclease [Rhodococcus rhodochrous]
MPGISKLERARREALLERGLKECTGPRGCGEARPLEEFRERPDGFAGRRAECTECEGAAAAAYRATRPEEEKARARAWQIANPERFRAITTRWRKSHPIEERLRYGRYRASQYGVRADKITPEELLADWKRRGIDPTRDVYTGEPLVDGWNIDHMTPLSKGGAHVINNLVPCNPGTNNSKHTRGLVGFLADRVEKETA